MKNLNLYITEKFKISSSPDKKYFTDVVPDVNFENPTDEDAKKLEDALKKAGVFPSERKLDGRYTTINRWFIRVNKYDELSLCADAIFSKPYKKKQQFIASFIDFSEDSFIACDGGGSVMYKNESPVTWEKVIMPIANFFGAKYTKDGEFVMPGTKSRWND